MRKRQSYKHHGLTVYETDDGVFAIGSEGKAQRAAERAARESLWAFRTEHVIGYLIANRKDFARMSDRQRDTFAKALAKLQEELCEDATPIVAALLGPKVRAFVEQAIRVDGRGFFLAGYDHTERDSDDCGFKPGRLCYRIN